MAYTLEAFCDETRSLLKKDSGRSGVENIIVHMERLIKDPEFIQKHFHDKVELGVRSLYVDPELGFHVLGYRAEKDRSSPAHDHGDSWALYGQVRDYTDMTEYERVDDGSDPGHATLKVASEYRLNPGQAHLYWATRLHSTFTPANCSYLRVAGTDLEKRPRVRIDQKTGKVMS